jgi:hypothetical protein
MQLIKVIINYIFHHYFTFTIIKKIDYLKSMQLDLLLYRFKLGNMI